MKTMIRRIMIAVCATAVFTVCASAAAAPADKYPYYPDDPTVYTPQEIVYDENIEASSELPLLYPGESISFSDPGWVFVSSKDLTEELNLDPENTEYTTDGTVYRYTKIAVSPDGERALALTTGEKDADAGTIEIDGNHAPLYIKIEYDFKEDTYLFGQEENPGTVLNPKETTYLKLKVRPYRESFHLKYITGTGEELYPDVLPPAGAVAIVPVREDAEENSVVIKDKWTGGATIRCYTNGGKTDLRLGYGSEYDPVGEFDLSFDGDDISADCRAELDGLLADIPTREGYVFDGWYADDALSVPVGDDYSGIAFSSEKYNYEIYAAWKEKKEEPASKLKQTVTLVKTSYTKTFGNGAFSLGAKTDGDGTLKYSSSNTKVATVSSSGKVTVKGAGKATVTVYATEGTNYLKSASKTVSITVNKAKNTLKAKGKTVTVKYSKVKKAKQTIARKKAISVSKSIGTVTYTKTKGNKKITVSKSGKITVKKGIKKGTYKVKVKVRAKGNSNYNGKTKTVTVTIKVK